MDHAEPLASNTIEVLSLRGIRRATDKQDVAVVSPAGESSLDEL
jgi:hypothetical protein